MSAAEPLDAPPRLRGVWHQGAFFAAVAAAPLLFAVSGGRWPIAVYAGSLVAMLGISAAYHRGPWSAATRRLWKRADHAAIFVFIAGTYTPICLMAMPGAEGRWLLTVVWTGAVLGVLRAMAWPSAPRWVAATLGILLGWAAVLAMPAVLRGTGPGLLGLILAGGAFYTLGGIIYALRWPDPWPRAFGYHEVFHALTIVAVILHFAAILTLARARAADQVPDAPAAAGRRTTWTALPSTSAHSQKSEPAHDQGSRAWPP